jgi:CubicO group peptidase (beta-lactamase class C family)
MKIISFYMLILTLIASCVSMKTIEEGVIPRQTDYKKFPSRKIENQAPVFHFYRSSDNSFGKKIFVENKTLNTSSVAIDSIVKLHKTIAFIIIRNDTILFEKYHDGYADTSIVSSFSVAKAFVASLVGIAINDGLIKSETDFFTDYMPEFKNINGFDKITIDNLLKHTSGIKFTDEEFDLHSDNAKFYWGDNLRKELLLMKTETLPDVSFHYSSANTQLLGLLLERVYGKSLSYILQEKIWKPLGMESPASWGMDRADSLGVEKAFCCIYARAIDFAKFGKLYLDNGKWNNKQIVPEKWVYKSTHQDLAGNNRRYYNNNFGLNPLKYDSFYAIGLYGQYIYCNREKNVIIVRFGKSDVNYNSAYWNIMMMQIIDQL